MVDSWGYHMLYNGTGCSIDRISDKENISRFVDTLVEEIDMVKYGPLWIERFAIHDPEKSGYSVFQMIETSHVACHFCENSGDAYVDIFSCKPFDTTKAEAVIAEYFAPATFSNRMIYRDAGKFI